MAKIVKAKTSMGKTIYKIVSSSGRNLQPNGIVAFRKKSRAKEVLKKMKK
jgi:hypothetical protein